MDQMCEHLSDLDLTVFPWKLPGLLIDCSLLPPDAPEPPGQWFPPSCTWGDTPSCDVTTGIDFKTIRGGLMVSGSQLRPGPQLRPGSKLPPVSHLVSGLVHLFGSHRFQPAALHLIEGRPRLLYATRFISWSRRPANPPTRPGAGWEVGEPECVFFRKRIARER